MTVPTGPGSDPFSYTEDTVSARLSVDVPADAINNLSQLQQGAHDLRTDMVATLRATENFAEYLRQLPALMEQTASATSRLNLGAAGQTGGLSSANDARPTNWRDGAPGTGAGRDADPENALGQLRANNPRQYGNLGAQQADSSNTDRVIHEGGGDPLPAPRREPRARPQSPGPSNRQDSNTRPGNRNDPGSTNNDPTWIDRAQQYQQRGDRYIDNVLGEARAGQNRSVFDTAQTGVRGLASGARNFEQQQRERERELIRRSLDADLSEEERAAATQGAQRARQLSGAAGTAVRGAGVAGLVVGGALATQKIGEQYQSYVAQGAVRGGGAAEGIAFEGQVRAMAMNPFISMEQSRKIMQTALSEGYTGKEFDTVTDFMAENLKKMNVDVATSVKVLQNNVINGGQSIEAAQTDLRTATQLAADPNATKTSAMFAEQYQQGTEVGLNAGAGGQAASEYGLLTAAAFSDDKALKGLSSVFQQGAANPFVQQTIANRVGYTGQLSGALGYALEQPNGADVAFDAQQELVTQVAQRYLPMLADPMQAETAIQGFMADMTAYGMTIDRNTAETILKQIMDGSFQRSGADAAKAATKASTGGDVQAVSQGGEIAAGGKALAAGVGGIGNAISFGVRSLLSIGGGDTSGRDAAYEAMTNSFTRSRELRNLQGGLGDTAYTNDRLTELQTKYGSENIKVQGEDGQGETNFDTGDKEMMQAIVDGKRKINVDGMGFSTLEDFSKQQQANDASASGGGTFDLTEQAKQLLVLIPKNGLNQTQTSANSGQDGATRNDPMAGQGYGN